MSEPSIEALGDCALLIRFGNAIDAELNAKVIAAAQALRDAALTGVHDIAPAYASVCVRYDPVAWSDRADRRAPSERLAEDLRTLLSEQTFAGFATSIASTIEIPVCYDGEFAPDLLDVARYTQMNPEDVIARHVAGDYRVAMLGFAPGFPYLLGMEPSLQTPRRLSPRTHVPAGSVAIGGAQTGIYPRELPGGWHIIGRTPIALFDINRDSPALLAPGARVRFRRIDAASFETLRR
jgi:KipI family sensor histidine kinase inhibitor